MPRPRRPVSTLDPSVTVLRHGINNVYLAVSTLPSSDEGDSADDEQRTDD